MITLSKIGDDYNIAPLTLYGLSSDTKPTTEVQGQKIVNTSIYYEMDTKKVFLFDEQNTAWLEQ